MITIFVIIIFVMAVALYAIVVATNKNKSLNERIFEDEEQMNCLKKNNKKEK